MQPRIYIDSPENDCFKLYATIPVDSASVANAVPVHLLYRMDTHSQPGHYDLLVPKCHLGATSPPATTLASSQSNISFEEFLKDAFVLADKSTMPPPSNDSSCITPNASPEDPLICNMETNTTDGND